MTTPAIVGYWLLVVGYWLLVIGDWLLFIGEDELGIILLVDEGVFVLVVVVVLVLVGNIVGED